MASLTTVYFIGIMMASAAGMGSAFVGNRFFPIKGGAEEELPTPQELVTEAERLAKLQQKLADNAEKVVEAPPQPEAPKEPVVDTGAENNPFKQSGGGDDSSSVATSISSSDDEHGGYRKYLRTARRNRYLRR